MKKKKKKKTQHQSQKKVFMYIETRTKSWKSHMTIQPV